MERPGMDLLYFLFSKHDRGVCGRVDPFGIGNNGTTHARGFTVGGGSSRYHRVTGRHRQRRANRRAARKAVR